MASSKKSSSPVSSSDAIIAPVTVSPVPTVLQPLTSASSLLHAPSVPNGFQPLDKLVVSRLKKFTKSQRNLVGPVATEVDGSTTYSQDFGTYAPAQSQVVALLEATEALISEQVNALDWAKYVGNLMAVNIDAAETELATMGQGLSYAAQHNSAVLNAYPQLMAFLKQRSVEVSKTFATTAAVKKAAEKKAKAGATTAEPTATPAAAAK